MYQLLYRPWVRLAPCAGSRAISRPREPDKWWSLQLWSRVFTFLGNNMWEQRISRQDFFSETFSAGDMLFHPCNYNYINIYHIAHRKWPAGNWARWLQIGIEQCYAWVPTASAEPSRRSNIKPSHTCPCLQRKPGRIPFGDVWADHLQQGQNFKHRIMNHPGGMAVKIFKTLNQHKPT